MRASDARSQVSAIASMIGLAACAASPEPIFVPPRETIVRDAAAALAEKQSRAPFELPPAGMSPAAWLSRAPREPIDPIGDAKPVFVGMEVAIAHVTAGYLALHRRLGVVGPLRLPDDLAWVGLDGRDRVLAATREGALLRAEDVNAAREGRFERAGQVPGAIAWDANSSWIAAATRAGVLVSSDGGRSFRHVGPDHSGVIERVFVRGDGVVVAQQEAGEDGMRLTWIGGPGRRLARSPMTFGEIQRIGGWIGGASPCATALSADGARWALLGRWPTEDETARWTRAFAPAQDLVPYARDLTGSFVDPAPPPSPSPGDELLPHAMCGRHLSKPPRVRMGATQLDMQRCAGAAYLGGVLEPPPEPAAFGFVLLRDGRCALADEDPDAFDEGACRAGAPLTRAPSVAVLDRRAGSLTVAALPPGCVPRRLLSAAGAGVLVCAGGAGGEAVYFAGTSGSFTHEGSLPLDAAHLSLSAAPDGTLLLRSAWHRQGAKRAFVRSPVAPGASGAWREVDLEGVFEVRVDIGGALVMFATKLAAPIPSWLTLARDAPGEPRRAISGRISVAGALVDAQITNRALHVWQSDRPLGGPCRVRHALADRDHATRWVLARDGSLRPVR